MIKIIKQKLKATRRSRTYVIAIMTTLLVGLYSSSALAVDAISVGTMADNVTKSFAGLAKLITAGSYIAGMGFALAAILKFKQHKDNPTQITIGAPIALLFIAAALIFLPTIFGVASQTIFGTSASVGGVTGISTF